MNKKTKMIFANMLSALLALIITVLTIIYLPRLHSDSVENESESETVVTTTEITTENIVTTTISTSTTSMTTTTVTTLEEMTTTTVATSTTKETSQTTITECDDTETKEDEQIKNDTYLFYKESMRVHELDCIYADSSCMDVINGDYIDEARPCLVCNPDINIGTIYEPPYEQVSEEKNNGLERNWSVSEMTYYSSSYGCYGASGRTLINNYSVACNSIPLGTTVYIKSSDGSVDGYYRVDDTGGMGSHVIDIFYSNYSNAPSSFRQSGRVSCEVWIVG